MPLDVRGHEEKEEPQCLLWTASLPDLFSHGQLPGDWDLTLNRVEQIFPPGVDR